MAGAIHMRERMQVPAGPGGLAGARGVALDKAAFNIPAEMAGFHRRGKIDQLSHYGALPLEITRTRHSIKSRRALAPNSYWISIARNESPTFSRDARRSDKCAPTFQILNQKLADALGR